MKKTLLAMAAMLTFGYANAQMKIGSNPTATTPTANFEVEAANGEKVIVEKATSKVGIGITSPSTRLHIAGALTTQLETVGTFSDILHTTGGGAWGFGDASRTISWGYNVAGATAGDGLFLFVPGNFRPSASYSDATISIFNEGNSAHKVGIATINPTTTLDVNGTTKTTNLQVVTGAGAGKVLTSDATGLATWATPSAGSNLYTADGTLTGARTVTMGANNLAFTGTGKVGIGTTTPSNSLHVVATADPIKAEGLQPGAASDFFVSTDVNGVFHTLSATKPQIAAVRLSTAPTTARGGAGGAYHFPAALTLANTIPTATIATNGDITLPAGTYQVVVTIEGGVSSDATPPAAGFYIHSYFYDFKTTGSSVRVHNNTSSNVGAASNHGISITYITTVNAGTTFPFNIGWGQGGNVGTSANMYFGSGCQLSVTKLL
jgi:hypothetical protein